MPIFPEIDLSRFAVDREGQPMQAAQNNMEGLPPGDPVGVMAGLNASLIALLANFSPGDLGVCVIDEKLQLSLAVPDWATWAWIDQGSTASISAASSDPVVLFTVPSDERAWLDGVIVERASGDNDWHSLIVTSPADYRSGTGVAVLLELGTYTASIYWPRGGQVIRIGIPDAPVLLEPGSLVSVLPDGTGVSATVGDYQIMLRRTKFVRALTP